MMRMRGRLRTVGPAGNGETGGGPMRSGRNRAAVLFALLLPLLLSGPGSAGPGDRAAQSGEYRAVTFYVA